MTAAAFTSSVDENPQLKRLAEQLAKVAEGEGMSLQLGEGSDAIPLPPVLTRLLRHSVAELLSGQAVTLVPTEEELSTFEAAHLLGVSRPFLIANLLDTGRLPCRKVGTHRRVALSDVLAYQADLDRRRAILDDLTAEEQRLGLY